MQEWLKAIIILPFNVTVVIPYLILYISKFQYNIPNIIQIIFGIILFIFGLFLAIWTMILFNTIGKDLLK